MTHPVVDSGQELLLPWHMEVVDGSRGNRSLVLDHVSCVYFFLP